MNWKKILALLLVLCLSVMIPGYSRNDLAAGAAGLDTAITEAQKLQFYDYTHESWEVLRLALRQAKAVADNPASGEQEIAAALQALTAAMEELAPKTNLAAGSTATSTNVYNNMAAYNGQKAVDGDLNTRWASNDRVAEAVLIIDLGAAQTFNQVLIFEFMQYAGRIGPVDMAVSADSQSWEAWRSISFDPPYYSAVGEPVAARYLRLRFSGIGNDGINVAEVMVFDDPSAVEIFTGITREEDPDWIVQQPGTEPNIFQQRKAAMTYGMFIHYGINTFANQEWTDGSLSPSVYNPNLSTLDPDSWVRAAWEGGMNFIVLVTKHHEGFALWDTAVGSYNIKATGRPGADRDIVREVSDACRKYGIKLGFYYSLWDRSWDRTHTVDTTGMNPGELKMAYNDFALAQIAELLDGRYGEICELWLDGAWEKKAADWELPRLYDTVKRLQPSCQMSVNWTVEPHNPADAKGGEPMRYFPSDFRLADPLFTRRGPNADPKLYTHMGQQYYLPFEATICINNSWFWNTGNNAASVMSPQSIETAYDHMAEQQNTLVLNLAPNRSGVMAAFDLAGLYTGARQIGIARGGARTDIPDGSCRVDVRYLTDRGHIIRSTDELYGEAGTGWTANAPELEQLGYTLLSEEAASGTFAGGGETVTFVYKDEFEGAPPPDPPDPPKYGHVSGGDTLSVTDARLVLQHLVGKRLLTPEEFDLAAVREAGKVEISDARLILQRLVGKIDSFPREE
ncbi:MAG: alpha-L-fucosidase [Oscillospiraceae bacterium]|nr:alpha-L-fucosidase [Oscillospiraceae bacterium]